MTPIDTMLQKGHFSYQKYYLTKLLSNINGTLQKWHIKTYIIGFLKYYQHLLIEPTLQLDVNWKNTILKSHDHGSESHNKFKNSLLKITETTWQIACGHSFAR